LNSAALAPTFPTMERLDLSETEWRARLSPEQYHVLREAGTERAFAGDLNFNHATGHYDCAGCGNPLFESTRKFDSGSGWPSFTAPISPDVVTEHVDTAHGMRRVEIRCSKCDGHLGHVFDDGPRDDTGLRYCMNSVALSFKGD
jgi:peptide-methionine (R)-S-oxide reductase